MPAALFRDERGVAMVTAILVMFIVGALAAAGYTLASHDLDSSARDRRSMQAIHAAEAGIDRFLQYLSTAPVTSPSCALNETLQMSPEATFAVTATFYPDASGSSAALPCPVASIPKTVVIKSVGTVAGRSRTMEAAAELSTVLGGPPMTNAAVFADSYANWNGSATVLGNPDDADLYSNGDLDLSGGGGVYGNVMAQGSIILGGTTDVKKDAVAKGAMTITGGALVRGNARSSTAGITNGSIVYGNAYYCTGGAPGGTVQGARVQECPNPTLPSLPKIPPSFGTGAFPVFNFVPGDWQQQGYTVHTFSSGSNSDCTNAKNFIDGIGSGNYVVRIVSDCDLRWTSGAVVNTKRNLAIISNGTLTMAGGADFGNTTGERHKLHLMFDVDQPRPCTTTSVSFTGQSSTGSTNDTLIYTPCEVKFTGGSIVMTGQIVGGIVTFGSNSTITFNSVTIPGQNPTGFAEKETYRREVIG